jgi:L-alanine-DL-glutamate epimerase-like enolase superfamily enzyme
VALLRCAQSTVLGRQPKTKPMQITTVGTRTLRYPCARPFASAGSYFTARTALLVFVETDAGLTGVGEATLAAGPAGVTQVVIEEELTPMLLGEDPLCVEFLWQRMYRRSFRHGRRGVLLNAIAGIDIALWDIVGQAAGLPLYRVLGACHERLPTYASGGLYSHGKDARALAEECAGYVANGYKAVKMKVGRNHDLEVDRLADLPNAAQLRVSLEEDIERVRAVRDAIGPQVGLAMDANNAWDRTTALRFCREVADCRLLWLEEPVLTDDMGASAELARALDVPIAGYETETGLVPCRDLLAAGAVGMAQPDITYSGGFSEYRRIAALAEAYNVPLAPHAFSTAIVLAASVHLAASLPNGYTIEVDQNPNALREELLEEPLTVDSDGMSAPPQGPGLGVRLRQDVLDRYTVDRPEPATVR